MWWCGEDLVALYTLALLPSALFFFTLAKRNGVERSFFYFVTFEKFELFNLIETFTALVSFTITHKSETVNSFPDSGWERGLHLTVY
jgi:hypothetical protein